MITPDDKAAVEAFVAELDLKATIAKAVAEATPTIKNAFQTCILSIKLLDAANAIYAVLPYAGGLDALQNELSTIAKALEARAKALLAMQEKGGCE